MNITEVKVFPIDEEKLRAFVSVVFDGCFMVNDIKIIQGREGRFISMPSRRKKNGEFKDVAHPLNNETRSMIERVILEEYDRMVGGGTTTSRSEDLHTVARQPKEDRLESNGVTKPPVAANHPAPTIEPTGEQSLEEVAEVHLRDSFWST